MSVNTINFKDIEPPNTVEEFRENLKKYFCVIDGKTKEDDQLYVQDEWDIKVKNLDSLGSLYSMTKHDPPSIIPLVEWDMNDVSEYMEEKGLFNSSWGFFEETENYKIIESGVPLTEWNCGWVTITNQILREYFVKTLGEFSGFC